ncbi:hypothetical protein [Mucilaginibacter arboris]|uniref:DUF1570 domain-containing protein n=1 Tax=Mucilaginibacter arboris TaxID=2682090 RepID=A0A7K1T1K9_9SPHI|nr:hypothetical protein [Mucilaginibacter arboris]MVN23439.1 hypothetical protein [Mucilaginibacter arboris]
MPATRRFSRSLKPACYAVFTAAFFVFWLSIFSSTAASAQILNIQKFNCRLSKDDTETFTKIARYEAAFYDAVFETSVNDSLTININVFGRKDDFKKTPDGENAMHVSSDGYYLEKTGDVFVLKTDHANSTLLHEISHAFLHHNIKRPPKWFDEGLATYFGSLIVQDDKIFYTPVTGRIERIRELNEQGLLHLSDFLKNNTRNWGDDKKTITDQYTIAYSVIYFLVKTNLNLIKHLAVELKNGQATTASLAEMFGSMEFFENRYNNFYKQQH